MYPHADRQEPKRGAVCASDSVYARNTRAVGSEFFSPALDRLAGLALHVSRLDHQHKRLRADLNLPAEFVLHFLRHTYGTRLGEAGADVFAIMRLMGHSSATISRRYVHPTPTAWGVMLSVSKLSIGVPRRPVSADIDPLEFRYIGERNFS